MPQYKKGRRAPWQTQITDHTGRRKSFSFLTKADALEHEYLRVRTRLRIRAGLEPPFEPITFIDFSETWLTKRKKGKKASWAGEQTKLNNAWRKMPWATRHMHTVSRSEIERKLDALVQEGISPAYRNRHRALLHKMWEDAIRTEPPHATQNPLTKIPILSERVKVFHREKLTHRDQALAYVAAYQEHGAQWAVLASLLALSGARIDEAVVLMWEDIDFDRDTIQISKLWEIQTKKIQYRTKGKREGGEEYTVLLPELKSILLKWKRQTLFSDQKNFVVCDGRGKHYTYWQAHTIHSKALLRLSGTPLITLHGFRHFFGRYLRTLGFQGDDLRGLMRHKDSKTTEIYSPVDMTHLSARVKQQLGEGGNGLQETGEPQKVL